MAGSSATSDISSAYIALSNEVTNAETTSAIMASILNKTQPVSTISELNNNVTDLKTRISAASTGVVTVSSLTVKAQSLAWANLNNWNTSAAKKCKQLQ
ncbi:hypothetical protein [Secundilactobacillus odoratitofui]|uniref:hypothetical protein n=1 Tax=Secundilactobacillus odoratitofui TaxID=480930 RepID=UPI0006D24458|nr:hypothetical protein [Secundilactobacillus odoratitofui]